MFCNLIVKKHLKLETCEIVSFLGQIPKIVFFVHDQSYNVWGSPYRQKFWACTKAIACGTSYVPHVILELVLSLKSMTVSQKIKNLTKI